MTRTELAPGEMRQLERELTLEEIVANEITQIHVIQRFQDTTSNGYVFNHEVLTDYDGVITHRGPEDSYIDVKQLGSGVVSIVSKSLVDVLSIPRAERKIYTGLYGIVPATT